MPDHNGPDMIHRVCAWCGKALGRETRPREFKYPVTHGICAACSHILMTFTEIPIERLISRLDGPVLVLDDAMGEVVAANEEAATAFGKTTEEMKGRLGGDVTECVHAVEPEGCGGTVHCSGCTIRNLVMETAASGEGQGMVPAFQYRVTPEGIRKHYYLLSAEKLGNLVLLRIRSRPAEEG